jgi:vacuolar-type H+-ATPase subunit I/STV1
MNKILKILIVIAIIAALAVGSYILFRSVFEQREFMEVAGEVSGQATGLGTQAADYVKGNIPTIVAAGGTVTALGGVALSKINSAKQQATDIKAQATSQIDGLNSEKDKITAQYESLKTMASDKDKLLQEMTQRTAEAEKLNEESATIVSGYKAEIDTLKLESQELKETVTAQEQKIGYLKAQINEATVP